MRFLSTERLAGLSARRPRGVVAAWVLAFVAAVAIIATLLPSALTTDVHLTGDQESRRADVLLSERLPESQRVVESLVVHSPALTVDDPAFRAKVASLRAELGALGSDVVAATGDPYAPGGVVAPDRHTTIVPVTMQGDLQEAGENAAAVLAVQADAQRP
jgi:RND superfamily putative drug exporter